MDSLVDLSDIQRLIEIVERHGLEGLSVSDAGVEIDIVAEQPPAGASAGIDRVGDLGEVAPIGPPPGIVQLKSPITGVFYRSPHPDEPLFCQVGEVVEESDVVGLIEAMKIFNEITAGLHGRLVRVVAANEQLVVTGEVLMEFEPLDAPGEEGN